MEQQNCHELFNLTIEQFARTLELGIPLEALFVMECILQGTDPTKHVKEAKMAAIKQLLTRKDFLFSDQLTPLGIETYESLRCGGMAPKADKKDKKESIGSFEVWWTSFPLHDGFEVNGKKFEKTRGLRVSKQDCMKLFTNAVKSGPYSDKQIIDATLAHVAIAKKQSLKLGQNKLSFIHNSATYLRQKDYEAWIGDSIEMPEAETSNRGPVNLNIDL